MSNALNESTQKQPQPENLHLRLSRQCDALQGRQSEVLGLFDDLPTYEETMRGFSARTDRGPIAFEELPAFRDRVISGLNAAIAALEEIESQKITEVLGREVGINLQPQKQRLQAVRDRVKEIDVSDMPRSGQKIERDVRNAFVEFTRMTYGSRDLESIRHFFSRIDENSSYSITLNDGELGQAAELIRGHRVAIMEPVMDFDAFTDALVVVHEQAKKSQKPLLQPKLQRLRAIVSECAAKGGYNSQGGDPRVDVADPLQSLLRKVEVIERGGQEEFWTQNDFRRFVGPVFEEAYKLIERYGYRTQLEIERGGSIGPSPVTEEGTKKAGDTGPRRTALQRLLSLFR